jgi:hypothetical protein
VEVRAGPPAAGPVAAPAIFPGEPVMRKTAGPGPGSRVWRKRTAPSTNRLPLRLRRPRVVGAPYGSSSTPGQVHRSAAPSVQAGAGMARRRQTRGTGTGSPQADPGGVGETGTPRLPAGLGYGFRII